jgi:hypothetical protein
VKKGVCASLYFGFAFTYPKDWVVNDEAINDRIRERFTEEAAKTGTFPEMKDTYLLLTVSRHPRGHPVPLNPTILVAAEKISPEPGNPGAKDYLLSLRSLKAKEGRAAAAEGACGISSPRHFSFTVTIRLSFKVLNGAFRDKSHQFVLKL